jgi:hypothetical protein
MRFAINDAQRIEAGIKAYEGNHAALSSIPLFGPLASRGMQLIDTVTGNSPEDIQRNLAEAQRSRELFGASTAASMSNYQRRASAAAAGFPNGNLFLELAANKARLKGHKMELGNLIDETAQKYQSTDAESQLGFFGRIANTSALGRAGFARTMGGDGFMEDAQKLADVKNQEIDQARRQALRPLKAQSEILEIEEKAADHKLKFASDQLRLQMVTNETVSNLTTKMRFHEADTEKRWGDFMHEFNSTPEELKKQMYRTAFAGAAAERFQMITDSGRTMAGTVDVQRDIIGDPSNLRHIVDPMVGLGNFMRRAFSFGATVLGP